MITQILTNHKKIKLHRFASTQKGTLISKLNDNINMDSVMLDCVSYSFTNSAVVGLVLTFICCWNIQNSQI